MTVITLHDAVPVVVFCEMTEREANWVRLSVGAKIAAIRIEDGATAMDRDVMADGPLGVPVALRLPRHVAAANDFPFWEVDP